MAMHEHTGAAVGPGSLLGAVVLCAVLAATLVLCRRLVGERGLVPDRATSVTHAGMGAAMVCTMVFSPARPLLVAGGTACVLAAGFHCRRALGRGRPSGRAERVHRLATAGMALTMALMLVVVQPGTALTVVLAGCLSICGGVYGASAARSSRNRGRDPSELPHLAMTAGMLAMVSGL
jgi:hypothetical protein